MRTSNAIINVIEFTMVPISCNNSQMEETNHSTAVPKMAMTTEIPEGILTPNTLNSSTIGELNFFDGVPVPEAPVGMENNWIQTVPGKGWNTIFRLYGPLEPWFDKTWRPSDFELVN